MSSETSVKAAASTDSFRDRVRPFLFELLLTLVVLVALASLSSFRFLRQSEAPHFVYQAQAFLEGHASVDPQVLPNLEDWACVRSIDNVKYRCSAPIRESDNWYSSFPPFPAVVMLPFVAVNHYQLNDTSFTVLAGALAVLLLFRLFKRLFPDRSLFDNVSLALLFCFGSLFASIAIRGEVWFSAEVLGVVFTCLYLLCAVEAKQPLGAGVFWSMAVVTRAPLFFTGVFFVLEAVAHQPSHRWQQLKGLFAPAHRKKLGLFALGAAPLGLWAAWLNATRFGSVTEFGHRFLFNNRVNADIDTYGLFHPHYLLRNLEAAFLRLPQLSQGKLLYDPWGLSLFLTLPLLALAFSPSSNLKRVYQTVSVMAGVLLISALFPPLPPPNGAFPIGFRDAPAWLAVAALLGFLAWQTVRWAQSAEAPRLLVPIAVTLLCCSMPGLLYQNTGYAQFGFRFSLDYTPYLFILIGLGGWTLRQPLVLALSTVSVLVNFWGAVAFRGYTEMVRGWM